MGKTESNRKNAERSTGPNDTSSTRLNAVKHALLAQGITELDDSDAYDSLLQRLTAAYRPVGDIETFFVERIAFHMMRLKRAGRLEAEYITGEIHPRVPGRSLEEVLETEPETLDPVL
jgi:hypothetical protein